MLRSDISIVHVPKDRVITGGLRGTLPRGFGPIDARPREEP